MVYVKQDSGASLTDTEKNLIANTEDFSKETPKLISETSPINPNNPNHHIVRWLLIGFILLLLIGGAYALYGWSLSKKVSETTKPNFLSSVQTQPPPAVPIETTTTTSPDNTANATGSQPSEFIPPTSTPTTKLTITQTPTGYLNVRSQPSSAGTIVTKVHPGETYVYTNKQNSWYQITLNDGTQGWISGQYVTLQ